MSVTNPRERRSGIHPALSSLAVLALVALGFPADADADAEKLPSAASVLDKHVAATGGERAHLQLKTRTMVGKLSVDMAGHRFEARVERHAQAPNNSHLLIQGKRVFKVSATNGVDAWQWSPVHSHDAKSGHAPGGRASLLKGAQKAQVIDQGSFHAVVGWRQRFDEVETSGLVDVEGRPAYRIEVTTRHGSQFSQYYDQENGRLVRYTFTQQSAHMGALDIDVLVKDYREFDGVWLPTRIVQRLRSANLGEGTQTWTYSAIQHGVEIAPSLFQVPEELRG